jgi:hypothetical protein
MAGMNAALIADAVTAAVVAFAAGWAARGEVVRRRDRNRGQSYGWRLHSAFADGDRWLLRAVCLIKGEIPAEDEAVDITVVTRTPDGERIAYGMGSGDMRPERGVLSEVEIGGMQGFAWHSPDVPDDASELGGAE